MRERQVWVGLRVAQPAAPRRVVELPGALPPAVAAAMVELVVDRGLVVDPCCGSGTIPLVLGTAIAADFSADAVAAARANGVASLLRADARRVPIRDNSATAVVTNLPFGRQHLVQGSPVAWYRRVLSETLRIAPQAVVLAAATTPFRQALGRLDVDLRSRHDLVLRGNRTAIWDVRRQSSGSARRKVSPRGERR